MTPKSLLRHKAAVSPVDEFVNGRFHEVLDDAAVDAGRGAPRAAVQRQGLLRSAGPPHAGESQRMSPSFASSSFIRSRKTMLTACLKRYRKAQEWVWVQEESQNMGGWTFMEPRLRDTGIITSITLAATPAPARRRVRRRFICASRRKLLKRRFAAPRRMWCVPTI